MFCFLVVTLFFFAIQVYAVQLAWNNSIPEIFKLPHITFLGAFCLLFLAQSFFTSTIQNISNVSQSNNHSEFSSEV
jgi:hypothetical protein